MARRRSVTTYCSVDGGRHAKGNGAAPLHLHAPSQHWRWCEDRRDRGSGRPSGVATPQIRRSRGRGAGIRQRARSQPGRGPAAPGPPWAQPAEERPGNALVAAAARAVRELPGDHPAGRHRHIDGRMAAAGAARVGPALRSHRHSGDRRAQRPAGLRPGGAGREVGTGADGPCRSRSDRGSRRRTTAGRDPRHRSRRHRDDRGRRQDPGRCAHHRKRQPADGRSSAHRRKHAGGQGDAGHRRRRRPR